MGNCCCFCPWTKPRKYLYRLNRKQKAIIMQHCPVFDDIKYLVKRTLPFSLNYKEYTVKQGFVSDGVSSGCFISNLIGVDTAIMHDFLYATHPDTKNVCDCILQPSYRRCVVGIFGQSAWDDSGKRGALVVTQTQKKNTDTGTGSYDVTFTVYHVADYHNIDQTIILSESESREFDSFFEMLHSSL